MFYYLYENVLLVINASSFHVMSSLQNLVTLLN